MLRVVHVGSEDRIKHSLFSLTHYTMKACGSVAV